MPPLTLAARIQQELRVRVVGRATGPWTEVRLGHVHVPEAGEAGEPRFLLTTELAARLSPSHFDRGLAAKINQASREKGRVVFAVDLALNEVVAAIAYHIPEDGSSALLITALAPRIDGAAPVGRACVPMLKACLHQLGAYLGRGGQLGLRPGGAPIDEAKQLYGFRPAPRGTGRLEVVLVQDAPHIDELPSPGR
jgi:hypothetical protein